MKSLYPICVEDKVTLHLPYIKRVNGADEFECIEGTTPFYAIVPNFVPIPTDTVVVCATMSGDKISDISYKRDPSINSLENCIAFITWTKPVPNTVPLYFYNGEHYIYPTFTREKRDRILKVYVMLSPYNFFCYQNRCVPSKNSTMDIANCTVVCNQDKSMNVLWYINHENTFYIMTLLIILLIIILIFMAQ